MRRFWLERRGLGGHGGRDAQDVRPVPAAQTRIPRPHLTHLVNAVQNLSAGGVGLRVPAGQGARIDTTTGTRRLVFGSFAALPEFEDDLIRERTVARLNAARARGRKDGRKFALWKAQVRMDRAAMANRDTAVRSCTGNSAPNR